MKNRLSTVLFSPGYISVDNSFFTDNVTDSYYQIPYSRAGQSCEFVNKEGVGDGSLFPYLLLVCVYFESICRRVIDFLFSSW